MSTLAKSDENKSVELITFEAKENILGVLNLLLVGCLELVLTSDMYIKSLSICTWIRTLLRLVGRPSLGHTFMYQPFGETK